MANTLSITEVTLAQISDAANAINLRAARPDSLSQGGPLVCRVTNHTDNDAGETGTDTDKMAIFHSRQFGQPWTKDTGLVHKIHKSVTAGTPLTAAADATVIFPDYDYTTFE